MTSAKLFSKFCKENRRQKGWLWILSGLIFTVFTFTFFMQDVLMDSDEMYFGLYNTKMMWITLAVAAMIAFQGYGFLLQAKTVDFTIVFRSSEVIYSGEIIGMGFGCI